MARDRESKNASDKPAIGLSTPMCFTKDLFHIKRSKNVEMSKVKSIMVTSVIISVLERDLRTSRSMLY